MGLPEMALGVAAGAPGKPVYWTATYQGTVLRLSRVSSS